MKKNLGLSKAKPSEGEKWEPELIMQSSSIKELQIMRKDFSHDEDEPLTSWLLQHWDNGANTIDLESTELTILPKFSEESSAVGWISIED